MLSISNFVQIGFESCERVRKKSVLHKGSEHFVLHSDVVSLFREYNSRFRHHSLVQLVRTGGYEANTKMNTN